MEIDLDVKTRTDSGKGPARQARAAGLVPAVFYGRHTEPVSLLVEAKALGQALHTEAGANVLINIEVDGESHLTVLREIQKHPIRGEFLHADFVRVARDVKITATVQLHIVGESEGVKHGGQLDQYLHDVEVEALPSDIPSAIDVDVTHLEMGQSLKVGDVQLPPGVEVLDPVEELVVAVNEPTVMKIEEETEDLGDAEVAAPEEGAGSPEE